MRARLIRIEFDREDGEVVTVETNDGVVIEVCARSLWRGVPGDSGAQQLVVARAWVVVVSRAA
jgi:hypothetical protein